MRSLKSFIIAVPILILVGWIASANATSPAMKQVREKFVGHAKDFMASDSEILSLKANHPEIIFKHPGFTDHANYQTLRYHEVFVEKTEDRSREWEVFGAGVDVHFIPGRQAWSFGKRLLNWTNELSFSDLISDTSLQAVITQYLNLPELIEPNDFSIHRKILLEAETAIPVYWVDVKARALSERSGRILILTAREGDLLFNFSKHHHISIPPTLVRDGSTKRAFDKLSSSKTPSDAFTKKYQSYCQVVSQNKKSLGEPLLINPLQCDRVVENTKEVGKADPAALRASSNSEKILSYYLNTHDQYGFDNDRIKQTPIASIVHVGQNYDNAYWDADLEVMAYGDGAGDGETHSTHDYTLALDVSGHEFTHAIVSHTANFVTPGDPGALNEAFADIFGVLISRAADPHANWSIGAKLYDNQDGSSDEVALRSLSDPSKYKTSTTVNGQSVDVPFPDKYGHRLAPNEKCNDDNDQCEVHANSTIWSHNAYLFDSGLQKQGYTAAQADEMTGKVFFVTLTHRLHENSSMKESAKEVLLACHDLYNDRECSFLEAAFKNTELVD